MPCEPAPRVRKYCSQAQLRRTKCHRNPGSSIRCCCTILLRSFHHNCRTTCSSLAQVLVLVLASAVLWSALVSARLWSALVMAEKSAASVQELLAQGSPVEWELELDGHPDTNPRHSQGNLPRSSHTIHPQRNSPRTMGHHSSTSMAVLESAPAWAVELAPEWVQEWSWEAQNTAWAVESVPAWALESAAVLDLGKSRHPCNWRTSHLASKSCNQPTDRSWACRKTRARNRPRLPSPGTPRESTSEVYAITTRKLRWDMSNRSEARTQC